MSDPRTPERSPLEGSAVPVSGWPDELARGPLTAEQQLALLRAAQLAPRAQANEWESMGEAFEGLCKTGLALTVGFSVAAAFCKMMDQKKLDIPTLINRVAGGIFLAPATRSTKDDDKR